MCRLVRQKAICGDDHFQMTPKKCAEAIVEHLPWSRCRKNYDIDDSSVVYQSRCCDCVAKDESRGKTDQALEEINEALIANAQLVGEEKVHIYMQRAWDAERIRLEAHKNFEEQTTAAEEKAAAAKKEADGTENKEDAAKKKEDAAEEKQDSERRISEEYHRTMERPLQLWSENERDYEEFCRDTGRDPNRLTTRDDLARASPEVP